MVATDGIGRLGYEHEKHIVHARVVNDLNVGEIEGVFLTQSCSQRSYDVAAAICS